MGRGTGAAVRRRVCLGLAGLALLAAGAARAAAPALEVVPDRDRAAVGEPITLEVRAPLGERAELADPVPRLQQRPPEGFRILAADSLRRTDDRAFAGRLRVAFFRSGMREVPALALAYRPSPGAAVETLLSRPVPVEVVPVLPPGDQPLRDIKDLEPLPGRPRLLLWTALLAGGAGVGCALDHLRRRRRPRAAAAPPQDARSRAYDTALARIAEVVAAGWPARGAVDRHYELVADIVRRCLAEAEGVPAPRRTTAELLRALPPRLAGDGLGEACRRLLEEADLVKFAALRPDPAAAAAFAGRARRLLERWRAGPDAPPPVSVHPPAGPAGRTAAGPGSDGDPDRGKGPAGALR